MIRRRLIILSFCTACICFFARGQVEHADSTLRAVEARYLAGSYQDAEVEGRRLLETPGVPDSVRAMTERWIAFSLVAQGKSVLAQEHFTAVLRIMPDFDLDPVLTSPKILTVFRAAQRSVVAPSVRRDTVMTIHPAAPPISYRTLLFPGWEQLHTGRTTHGAVFLGAGAATLGSGIALEFLRSRARRDYLAATSAEEIKKQYSTYNRYYRAEIAAFMAFGAVYVASQFDVFGSDLDATVAVIPASPTPVSLTFRIPF